MNIFTGELQTSPFGPETQQHASAVTLATLACDGSRSQHIQLKRYHHKHRSQCLPLYEIHICGLTVY